jgi:hypothetical protein
VATKPTAQKFYPTLTGATPDVAKVIYSLYDQQYSLLDEIKALKAGNSAGGGSAMSLEQIQQALSLGGSNPINVTGLLGIPNTNWNQYLVNITPGGSMTWTPTIRIGYYQRLGKIVFMRVYSAGTIGGTVGGNFGFQLPPNCIPRDNYQVFAPYLIDGNGSAVAGQAIITNYKTVLIYKVGGTFTAGSQAVVALQGMYESQ